MGDESPPPDLDGAQITVVTTEHQSTTLLVRRQIGELEVIEVQMADLDALRDASSEENTTLGWTTLCVGIVVSTAIAWLASTGSASPTATAVYVAVTFSSGVLALYFGLRWLRARRAAAARFERIKKSANLASSHPVGQRLG